MKISFGILAHVDAGKTTLSEQILYQTGSIRHAGRVDTQSTLLDNDQIEKQRGITIFSGEASFSIGDRTYYLIDTPGHLDFSAETERAVASMDYAVLLLDASEGVRPHTKALFRMLERYDIPAFVFLNKCDQPGADAGACMEQLKKLFGDRFALLPEYDTCPIDTLAELTAEHDETFLETFFEGNYTEDAVWKHLRTLIQNRSLFPVFQGAALKGEGVSEFLSWFPRITETNYEQTVDEPFCGTVYKIRHDENRHKIAWVKATRGRLAPRAEFSFQEADGTVQTEKVQELRFYNGDRYQTAAVAEAGDLFAVTGLSSVRCGMKLSQKQPLSLEKQPQNGYFHAALQAKVLSEDDTNPTELLRTLRLLEEEDPLLSVEYSPFHSSISLHIMGKIQLEILKQLLADRFGIAVSFAPPDVSYQETLDDTIIGCGHYEPLRHYAEVHLRMEPLPVGSGIRFSSACHVDTLPLRFQNLVETHVFEKTHLGVLTGSPLTDLKLTLINGRFHQKHTEGGDFRESTYRAIRQGCEKARAAGHAVLLEPYYQFEIDAPAESIGLILSDLTIRHCQFDAPTQDGDLAHLTGSGPVATLMEYSSDILSMTGGRGSATLLFSGYYPCHNTEEVIEKIGYRSGADTENSADSVFCAKGAGYLVTWDQADNYMHLSDE